MTFFFKDEQILSSTLTDLLHSPRNRFLRCLWGGLERKHRNYVTFLRLSYIHVWQKNMDSITGCHEENLDKLKDLCSEPFYVNKTINKS